jgi:hypothetical protein
MIEQIDKKKLEKLIEEINTIIEPVELLHVDNINLWDELLEAYQIIQDTSEVNSDIKESQFSRDSIQILEKLASDTIQIQETAYNKQNKLSQWTQAHSVGQAIRLMPPTFPELVRAAKTIHKLNNGKDAGSTEKTAYYCIRYLRYCGIVTQKGKKLHWHVEIPKHEPF